MEFIEYPDQEMMMIDLANRLAGEVENTLLIEDKATLVVPGGNTPGPIFDSLCAADLAWDRVTVLLSDERWVPESSDRSNARLVRERLLTGRAAVARLLTYYREGVDPDQAMADLSEEIAGHLPVSVMLLGMGADMHTASIFPGADNLDAALDAGAPALMAMRAPGAPEPRITLAAPVISGALARHIVITGAEKREALDRARHGGQRAEAPVSYFLNGATVHWAE